MTCYSKQVNMLKDINMSFARNLSDIYGENLLDNATKNRIRSCKIYF